jgi:3'(2'), 5'-bisphosphate nucleotidase
MMEQLKIAISAAKKASDEILKVYYSDDFNVEEKSDHSPLTRADRFAHKAIVEILNNSAIPVLSEEGKSISYEKRKNWKQFWLVDPLDGTKEFIKRNGEFTVNIALIREGLPVLGVILVPVSGELYFASEELGSYKIAIQAEDDPLQTISTDDLLPLISTDKFTAVVSRSHMSKETEDYLGTVIKSREKAGLSTEIDFLSRGSSLKICMVAEGLADVYPRFGPTMEWDTAAGHAIAKFAGKQVIRTDNYQELTYNKENLLNPYFIVK